MSLETERPPQDDDHLRRISSGACSRGRSLRRADAGATSHSTSASARVSLAPDATLGSPTPSPPGSVTMASSGSFSARRARLLKSSFCRDDGTASSNPSPTASYTRSPPCFGARCNSIGGDVPSPPLQPTAAESPRFPHRMSRARDRDCSPTKRSSIAAVRHRSVSQGKRLSVYQRRLRRRSRVPSSVPSTRATRLRSKAGSPSAGARAARRGAAPTAATPPPPPPPPLPSEIGVLPSAPLAAWSPVRGGAAAAPSPPALHDLWATARAAWCRVVDAGRNRVHTYALRYTLDGRRGGGVHGIAARTPSRPARACMYAFLRGVLRYTRAAPLAFWMAVRPREGVLSMYVTDCVAVCHRPLGPAAGAFDNEAVLRRSPTYPAGVRAIWGGLCERVIACARRERLGWGKIVGAALAAGLPLPAVDKRDAVIPALAARERRGRQALERRWRVDLANIVHLHRPELPLRAAPLTIPNGASRPRRESLYSFASSSSTPTQTVLHLVVEPDKHSALFACLFSAGGKMGYHQRQERDVVDDGDDDNDASPPLPVDAAPKREVRFTLPDGHRDEAKVLARSPLSVGRLPVRGRPLPCPGGQPSAAGEAATPHGDANNGRAIKGYHAFLRRYREAQEYAKEAVVVGDDGVSGAATGVPVPLASKDAAAPPAARVDAPDALPPPYTLMDTAAQTPQFYMYLEVLTRNLHARYPTRLVPVRQTAVQYIKALRPNPAYTAHPRPPAPPVAFVAKYTTRVYRRGRLRVAVRKAWCVTEEVSM